MQPISRTIIAIVAVAALGAGTALAQYPPPGGNITTSTAGNQLTVTVSTQSGAPSPNVVCVASVGSQPGTGASVSPTNFTTNAQGRAVLNVTPGSGTGQVRIDIACGTLSASAVLPVGAQPAPPSTGSGGEDSSSSGLPLALFGGALALAAVAGLAGYRRLSRAR
jgi:hypothetical protein